MRPRLLAALGLAVATLGFCASTASAECFPFPESATAQLDVGYAFIATVTESSRDVDPPETNPPDGPYAPFDWHIEFAVDRTYLGKVPTKIVYNGWDVGCHELRADHLTTGDKVFILAEAFHPEFRPRDPFDGDVVVWKATASGWRFDPDVLMYGSNTKVYTKAVRDASTSAEILRIVAAHSLAQTDTIAPQTVGPTAIDLAPVLVFVGSFVLALLYLTKRDVGAANARDIRRR
jgi:hypothetical protein